MNPTYKKIVRILKGICQTQIESEDGWWETSIGAEFGEDKLAEIKELFNSKTDLDKFVELYKSFGIKYPQTVDENKNTIIRVMITGDGIICYTFDKNGSFVRKWVHLIPMGFNLGGVYE